MGTPSIESAPNATGGRAMCYRCFKPAPDCVCADMKTVDNRTGVIIVQHPRERNHPFGTARFARLGLRRVQIRVCHPNNAEAIARASALPPNTALLYPSPGAREVGTLRPFERPDHIVLVDATWHQAKAFLRETPWLRSLPHIRLDPAAPSEYRVRREPRADCLSTIEATVAALRALEPETHGLENILVAFRRMNDRQLERSQRSPARRVKVPRSPRTPVPSVFAIGYSRLVVVYGEVSKAHSAHGTAGEVAYWCAARPATGEVFARFVRPSHVALNPVHIAHMGLSVAQIDGGVTQERFRDEWRGFLRPDDIVTAWNRRSLDSADPPTEPLLLKAAACNLIGRSCGHLGDFVQSLDLTPLPTPFKGRAGGHMGFALAVAEYMRRLGIGDLVWSRTLIHRHFPRL